MLLRSKISFMHNVCSKLCTFNVRYLTMLLFYAFDRTVFFNAANSYLICGDMCFSFRWASWRCHECSTDLLIFYISQGRSVWRYRFCTCCSHANFEVTKNFKNCFIYVEFFSIDNVYILLHCVYLFLYRICYDVHYFSYSSVYIPY
jgi:hypothetical protein